MNVPGLLIAVAFGGAFFAIEYGLYYQPDFINADALISTLSPEHRKARAAVRHALINPDSAQFGTLRSVEADAARYVCGAVSATDKSGHSVNAAFVYTVAVDYARIDDDARITYYQSGYRPCPTGKDKVAQQRPAVSPGLASAAKVIQQVAPEGLTSVAPVLTAPAPSAGGSSSGGTMEQQVRELATRTVPPDAANRPQPNPAGTREAAKENERQAERPPAAWPKFPGDHPLAKPTRKRTPPEALKLADDVEDRWKQAEALADIAMRPSAEDINEACRALLAIDPRDVDYPKAWAAFTRLQKIRRDIAAG
ncbi:hypothetical protein [uncultured Bradyrhizobium sp.]|jgi:hypothetical protein|uniref:hypothetical protein n=1 Tax=uncultured Bradyrhizobium sp. TaxID=199684 RepID=UPI00260F8FAA|nr:hypothetical protein [uncultured Bradyrhizobium sp.]